MPRRSDIFIRNTSGCLVTGGHVRGCSVANLCGVCLLVGLDEKAPCRELEAESVWTSAFRGGNPKLAIRSCVDPTFVCPKSKINVLETSSVGITFVTIDPTSKLFRFWKRLTCFGLSRKRFLWYGCLDHPPVPSEI